MEYLQAAIELKKLIVGSNNELLAKHRIGSDQNNMIFLKQANAVKEKEMTSFTNEFVFGTIENNTNAEAFVITDLAKQNVEGKELTYFLYKGYHKLIEKGLVFFQVIDSENLKPKGDLLFSNLEDNIFFNVKTPEEEESSCNALETGEKTATSKGVAFLIGHMNENRLVYDIQRLIFDTCNNVQKHKGLKFNFVIQVSKFGGNPSQKLIEQISAIDKFTRSEVEKIYPNCTFKFEMAD